MLGGDAPHMPRRNGSGIELLADPTRRQIMALIARRVRRPSRLADEIGLSRPAISRQLRLLTEAGLIEVHRHPSDGRGYSYFIAYGMAAPIVAWLAGTGVALPGPTRRTPAVQAVSSDVARMERNAAPPPADRDVGGRSV